MHWPSPFSVFEQREGVWVKGCIMKQCSPPEKPSPRKWSSVSESLIPLIASDLVEFTDEEGYGRYLDLHDCYLKYINLKASEVRPRIGEGGSDSQGESGHWARATRHETECLPCVLKLLHKY